MPNFPYTNDETGLDDFDQPIISEPGGLMDDHESRELLRRLHKYVMYYAPDVPQTIPALAEDLAMSMNVTTDEDDRMRREIENAYA